MGNKLGGSLIGYAVKHNGTFRKVLFDKPIHNTITKSCLQNLLQWNGSDDLCTTDITGNYLSLFVKSSETSNRYGTFNFSALGNDNTPTTVDDVMLYNQIGSYTSTKMSGDGWCGSTIDGNSAIIRTRISHIHTITDTFTVREIGWFSRIYPDGSYSMSARVVLDKPVNVEPGDEFYSIYELTVQFDVKDTFSGLGDFGGGYIVNALNNFVIDAYWARRHYCFPLLNTSCTPYNNTNTGNGLSYGMDFIPIWMKRCNVNKVHTNWDKQVAFSSVTPSSYINYIEPDRVNLMPYDPTVPYTRTAKYLISQNTLSGNVYGIVVNGTLYRFGTYEDDTFTPSPVVINSALTFTVTQSWYTDLIHP